MGETEEFYQSLQAVVSQVPEKDMVLILGGFNAQVGNDVKTWHGMLGTFGPIECNENGLRLLDFCSLNDFGITNTFFQHMVSSSRVHTCRTCAGLHPGQPEVQVQCVGYQSVPQDLPPIRSQVSGGEG